MADRTKECKVCGGIFTIWSNRQVYCSSECKAIEEKRRQREYGKKKEKKLPAVSIEDVVRFTEEYRKKYGKYLHYGEAVILMERSKDNGSGRVP